MIHWRIKQGYETIDKLIIAILPLVQPRLKTLNDIVDVAGFFFESEFVAADRQVFIDFYVKENIDIYVLFDLFLFLQLWFHKIDEFNQVNIEYLLERFEEQTGLTKKQLYTLLRLSIIGDRNSPPLVPCMLIFGKEEVINRLAITYTVLRNNNE